MAGPDWERYAVHRNLSRNRLLLARHAEVVEEFLRFFGQVPNDRKVLDIGPANGLFLALLRELGFERIEGLEISPVFLERLRAKGLVGHLGDIVEGRGLEALAPPYDVVLMMEILEHLPDPGRALAHVRSLLAPDGALYATVPACDDVFTRARRCVGRRTRHEQVMAIDETHLHAFSAATLRELLEGSGFAVEDLRRVSMEPPFAARFQPGHRAFALLRALLPRWCRGFFLAAVARPRAGAA